jgi:hypothetical protein
MNDINSKVYKHYLRPDLICQGRVSIWSDLIDALGKLSGIRLYGIRYEYSQPNIAGLDWHYSNPPLTKPEIDTGTFL